MEHERTQAIRIASGSLDLCDAGRLDPDSDEAVLARQFIRTLSSIKNVAGRLEAEAIASLPIRDQLWLDAVKADIEAYEAYEKRNG